MASDGFWGVASRRILAESAIHEPMRGNVIETAANMRHRLATQRAHDHPDAAAAARRIGQSSAVRP
jgi:hypothetical protein